MKNPCVIKCSDPSALDGKDAKHINSDWEKLEKDDLTARPLVISSIYFTALQVLYEDLGRTDDNSVDELARLAECARDFALAIRALRTSVDEMRAELKRDGSNEQTYRAFETHSRLYCGKWTLIGHRHKGYGFHFWAGAVSPVLQGRKSSSTIRMHAPPSRAHRRCSLNSNGSRYRRAARQSITGIF